MTRNPGSRRIQDKPLAVAPMDLAAGMFVAAIIPALRAASVSPIDALRAE